MVFTSQKTFKICSRFISTTAMGGDWIKTVLRSIQLFVVSEDVNLPSVNGVFISKDISRYAVDLFIPVICHQVADGRTLGYGSPEVYSHQAKLSLIPSKGTAELL
ncbi:hypothetical protein HOLleu_43869 [Holothuria leucospilota]|uniref:Uncharacterized protein n=1 Tax=Holothuria leucospilota TaxID=206669 RepID=A0A9Q0YGH9_HOLLE|nr:hypothetical protein HOLleu_43869 [Holothuria leucospilota]